MDLQKALQDFVAVFAADIASLEVTSGDMTTLKTSEKVTLAKAINELFTNVSTLPTLIFNDNNPSETTLFHSTKIVSLIEELKNNIVGDLVVIGIDLFDKNIIKNGDAEAIVGSDSGGGTSFTPPSWNCTGSVLTVQYANTAAGMLNNSSTVPANRGNNYFAGGPSTLNASMSQIINVANGYTYIDAGSVSFKLSGNLGGRDAKNDSPIITLTFIDYFGNESSYTMGPVNAGDRGYVTGLVYREIAGAVPKGTRNIRVNVLFRRYAGTYNDAYLDNLSLVLTGGTNSANVIGPINYSELSLKMLSDKVLATASALSNINPDIKFSYMPQLLDATQQKTTRVNLGLESNDITSVNLVAEYSKGIPVIQSALKAIIAAYNTDSSAYVYYYANFNTGELIPLHDLSGNPYVVDNNKFDLINRRNQNFSDTVRLLLFDYWNLEVSAIYDNDNVFTPVLSDKLRLAIDPTGIRNRQVYDQATIILYKGKYYINLVYASQVQDSNDMEYVFTLLSFSETGFETPVVEQQLVYRPSVASAPSSIEIAAQSPVYHTFDVRLTIYKDQFVMICTEGGGLGNMPAIDPPKTYFSTPPNKTDVGNQSQWSTFTHAGSVMYQVNPVHDYMFAMNQYYDYNNGGALVQQLVRLSNYVPGVGFNIDICTGDIDPLNISISQIVFDGARYIVPVAGDTIATMYLCVSTDGINFTKVSLVNDGSIVLPDALVQAPAVDPSGGTKPGKGDPLPVTTPSIQSLFFNSYQYKNGKYILDLGYGVFTSSNYNSGWVPVPNLVISAPEASAFNGYYENIFDLYT